VALLANTGSLTELGEHFAIPVLAGIEVEGMDVIAS
jgi:hypothetical protein